MMKTWTYLILLSLYFNSFANAQSIIDDMNITTKNSSERELQTVEQLKNILQTYDLSPWIYTYDIIIESRVIPHSHPVLTLSTRYLDDDEGLIATFLHEQLHWFEAAHPEQVNQAIEELRQKYPEVPFGNSEGAKNEYSSYLHLLVCHWEHQATAEVLGKEKSTEIMESQGHYTWIYERILEDEAYLQDLCVKYDIVP